MTTSKKSLLDADAVRKIAGLARLTVSDTEIESLQTDLNSILSYVKKLDEPDTSQVEPLSHVHGEQNKFREDVAYEYGNREKILENAPDRSGSFIKVPLIIDQESH